MWQTVVRRYGSPYGPILARTEQAEPTDGQMGRLPLDREESCGRMMLESPANRRYQMMNAMRRCTSLIACILACPLTCGCPLAPENNQAACRRVTTHVLACEEDIEVTPATVAVLVTMACDEVSDTSECDWPALADCITALSCEELASSDPDNVPCEDLVTEDCVADCGSIGPSVAALPIALVGFRFARRKRAR